MKRKIALILTAVLLLSSVLASCGKKCEAHVDADLDELCDACGEAVEYVPTYLPFEGTFNAAYEEDDDESDMIFGKAVAEGSLADMQFDSMEGDLVLFANGDAEAGELKAAVLNAETGAIVSSLTQEAEDAKISYDLLLESVYDESFIRVYKTDSTDKNKTVYTQTLYTALGKEIVSKTASHPSIDVDFIYYTADYEGGLYLIDDKVYEIVDSVATYKFDKGLKSIPDALGQFTGTNYYVARSGEIFVYDTEYNLVAYYAVPAGCELIGTNLISNGNVFVQYAKALPWDASEYGLYMDGEKYDFYSVIFNIADGTTKAVELNYVVESMFNAVESPELFKDYVTSEEIKNIAVICPIVDKRVDFKTEISANFNDDMFLLHYLGNEITNQEGTAIPLGDNRFIVENKSGKEFLINEKAELIGEITDADYYDADLKLFVMDGKYYDLDLKPVFDEEAIEYTYYASGDEYKLYCDVNTVGEGEEEEEITTYYILNGITLKKLALPEDAYEVSVNHHYFSYKYMVEAETEDEKDRYFTVYCNKKGEEIYKVETTSVENSYKYANVSVYGDVAVIKETTVTYDENYDYTYSYAYYIAK